MMRSSNPERDMIKKRNLREEHNDDNNDESKQGLVVFNRVRTICHLCHKILVDTWVPENEDRSAKLTVLCDRCLPSDHVDELLELLKHRIFNFNILR